MVPVTLKYSSPGAQPPVFLAGSFSEPAWDPIEMDYTTAEDGEHHFTKKVMVEEGGQFQYKFRIGTGDWWALDEDAPTGMWFLSPPQIALNYLRTALVYARSARN